jgi:hypothetical protein
MEATGQSPEESVDMAFVNPFAGGEMESESNHAARASPLGASVTSSASYVSDKQHAAPKKKRKSPAVPWKKPADMPKRPLSAYNLFFKAERALLLEEKVKGDVVMAGDDGTTAKASSTGTGSRMKKGWNVSGIGFSGLAKTIAAKWKLLAPDEKAPFLKTAALDKQRYDKSVAEWRVIQKEKKAAAEQNIRGMYSIGPCLMPSRHSLDDDITNSTAGNFPEDWFDASASSDHSLSEVSAVPSEVNARAHGPFRDFDSSTSSCWSSQLSFDYAAPLESLHSTTLAPSSLHWPSGATNATANCLLKPSDNCCTHALAYPCKSQPLCLNEFAEALSMDTSEGISPNVINTAGRVQGRLHELSEEERLGISLAGELIREERMRRMQMPPLGLLSLVPPPLLSLPLARSVDATPSAVASTSFISSPFHMTRSGGVRGQLQRRFSDVSGMANGQQLLLQQQYQQPIEELLDFSNHSNGASSHDESFQALRRNLDDDTIDFLTSLSFNNIQRPKRGGNGGSSHDSSHL